jgi:cytochrome b subunit of formate dehydrogenase
MMLGAPPGASADDASCLTCHGEHAAGFPESVHAGFGCQGCHADVEGFPHPERVARVACSTCHPEAVQALHASVHSLAREEGAPEAAGCVACHGAPHAIRPARDPGSPVSKRRLADTCGACHANPELPGLHGPGRVRPVEAWRSGVHGRAVERGDAAAPSCSSCHGSHAILPAVDPASSIHPGRVPATCGTCHARIEEAYRDSVHGRAALRGVRGAPVCTDCHGEHEILAPAEPGSPVHPARVSDATCGHCHSDERLLRRFQLPADRVPTFRESFHGLSARSGRQSVANCASCHGIHRILPASDPRSTIHPDNLARTCGSCHPGASERYALGPIHVASGGAAEHWTVRVIRAAYLWVILPLALGFMLLHNGIDFVSKVVRGTARPAGGGELPRMNRAFRVAHWGVQIAFVTLVVSGFALKFPESWWAAPFLRFESQVPLRGWVHRGAAVLLLAALAFHAVHLALRRHDRAILRHLVPRFQDARDLVQMLRYDLGLSERRPRFGVFSYGEKLEYLAFLWGTLLMSATGFLLWFESWSLRHLPFWTLAASTALHWYEAILATLSIVVWHLYAVVFDPEVYPMDRSWLTGRTSAEHLRRTRPAYHAALLRKARPSASGAEAPGSAAPGEPEEPGGSPGDPTGQPPP